jgi:hypothetical protein
MRAFCGCEIEAIDQPELMAAGKPRQFKFQLVYGHYPGFAFKGMNNAQTVGIIRKAMADLSKVSGAKFVESSSKPHLRFYFMKQVTYNAIGVYMGNGKVYLSQTRPITAPVAGICVQHEVGHFLGVKASPAADKWGPCPVKGCIMNINGTGPVWCEKCKSQLVRRYGRA